MKEKIVFLHRRTGFVISLDTISKRDKDDAICTFYPTVTKTFSDKFLIRDEVKITQTYRLYEVPFNEDFDTIVIPTGLSVLDMFELARRGDIYFIFKLKELEDLDKDYGLTLKDLLES